MNVLDKVGPNGEPMAIPSWGKSSELKKSMAV